MKTTNTSYKTLISTLKHELAIVHGQHRIYDCKTKHPIDHCDLPKATAQELYHYIDNYRDYGRTKAEGKKMFDKQCEEIMQNEWNEYDRNEADQPQE